jgi:hypothetical protein
MTRWQPFSRRNSLSGGPKGITIREDAPEALRYFVLDTARQLEYAASSLRTIICRALQVRPPGAIGRNIPMTILITRRCGPEEQKVAAESAWLEHGMPSPPASPATA